MRRRRAVVALVLLSALWLGSVAARIVARGEERAEGKADVAIVLGAAVDGDAPSPVFAERIGWGVRLYRDGRVGKLLFTGGYGEGSRHAEALVARAAAMREGVPAEDILVETRSRTTRQNLVEAQRVMQAEGLETALIVSDPLHMMRAMTMAEDLGLAASGSPTPTSRYRSWRSKSGFLARELYFYHHYLATGD